MGPCSAKALLFSYIVAPVAMLYDAPCSTSRPLSQAFFSEPVWVVSASADWVKVRLTIDNLSGWVPRGMLARRRAPFLDGSLPIAKVNQLAATLYSEPNRKSSVLAILPFESRTEIETSLPAPLGWYPVRTAEGRLGYLERLAVAVNPSFIALHEIAPLARKFVGVTYAPAGRTSFGYDAPGFVQMLYRQMGVYLPHSLKGQMKWHGFTQIPCTYLQPGDLIFFGASKHAVALVALALGCGYFAYADASAGSVQIANLCDPEWLQSGRYPYRTARTLRCKSWGDYYRSLF